MDAVDAVLAANKLTKRLGGGAVDVDQPYTTKNFSARVDGDTYGDDSFDIIKEMDEFMDRERLKKIAADARKAYKTARPFPNHVFDGIFPERMLRKVMEENPETLLVDGCLPGSEACLKGSYEGQQHKSSINNDKQMGIFTKSFFGYIKSSGFVHFLEELSQINGLIPDPHYFGAGLHFTSPGGKLDIHADFNALVSHKLERRVNTLLFLNDDWPSEYGGHLEVRYSQRSFNVSRCTSSNGNNIH
jgi:Rps23 Pro-64 3,4-dihydroxylase Tpa1-like proline 4-hydroxylase